MNSILFLEWRNIIDCVIQVEGIFKNKSCYGYDDPRFCGPRHYYTSKIDILFALRRR